jgi:uncharacterized membrane protein (UPF0127 family)
MSIKQVKYDEETDEYFIEFSEEEMEEIGWKIGDRIKWEDNGESIIVSKVIEEDFFPEMLK